MRPVLKELKKALNPEGGELCRFLINRKNNAARSSVPKHCSASEPTRQDFEAHRSF